MCHDRTLRESSELETIMTGSGYRGGSKRQMLAVETPTQRHLINTWHWLLSYAVTALVRLMMTQTNDG